MNLGNLEMGEMILEKKIRRAMLTMEIEDLEAKMDLLTILTQPNVKVIALTKVIHMEQARLLVSEEKWKEWDLITSEDQQLQLTIQSW